MALLRPRTNAELLDASFVLVRRHASQLLPVSLLLGLPVEYETASQLSHHLSTGRISTGRTLISMFVTMSFGQIRFWILQAALIGAMADGRVDWRAARRRVTRGFGRLLVSYALLSLLVALGVVALVVPGFILYLDRMLFSAAILAEGPSVRPLRRSIELADDSTDRLAGLVLASTAIALSLNSGAKVWFGGTFLQVGLTWLASGALDAVEAALYVLAYYDLRCRREGLDLLARNVELGRSLPSAA